MFCAKCGCELRDDAVKCGRCGAPVRIRPGDVRGNRPEVRPEGRTKVRSGKRKLQRQVFFEPGDIAAPPRNALEDVSAVSAADISPAGLSAADISPAGLPAADTSPAGLSAAGISPAGLSAADTSPAGLSAADISPADFSPAGQLKDPVFFQTPGKNVNVKEILSLARGGSPQAADPGPDEKPKAAQEGREAVSYGHSEPQEKAFSPAMDLEGDLDRQIYLDREKKARRQIEKQSRRRRRGGKPERREDTAVKTTAVKTAVSGSEPARGRDSDLYSPKAPAMPSEASTASLTLAAAGAAAVSSETASSELPSEAVSAAVSAGEELQGRSAAYSETMSSEAYSKDVSEYESEALSAAVRAKEELKQEESAVSASFPETEPSGLLPETASEAVSAAVRAEEKPQEESAASAASTASPETAPSEELSEAASEAVSAAVRAEEELKEEESAVSASSPETEPSEALSEAASEAVSAAVRAEEELKQEESAASAVSAASHETAPSEALSEAAPESVSAAGPAAEELQEEAAAFPEAVPSEVLPNTETPSHPSRAGVPGDSGSQTEQGRRILSPREREEEELRLIRRYREEEPDALDRYLEKYGITKDMAIRIVTLFLIVLFSLLYLLGRGRGSAAKDADMGTEQVVGGEEREQDAGELEIPTGGGDFQDNGQR